MICNKVNWNDSKIYSQLADRTPLTDLPDGIGRLKSEAYAHRSAVNQKIAKLA